MRGKTTTTTTTTQRSFAPEDKENENESLRSSLIPLEQEPEAENVRSKSEKNLIPHWRHSVVALFLTVLVVTMGPGSAVLVFLGVCLAIGCVFEATMRDTLQPTRAKAVVFHRQKPWLAVAYYSGDVEVWKLQENTGKTSTATSTRAIKFTASSEPLRACQFAESW